MVVVGRLSGEFDRIARKNTAKAMRGQTGQTGERNIYKYNNKNNIC